MPNKFKDTKLKFNGEKIENEFKPQSYSFEKETTTPRFSNEMKKELKILRETDIDYLKNPTEPLKWSRAQPKAKENLFKDIGLDFPEESKSRFKFEPEKMDTQTMSLTTPETTDFGTWDALNVAKDAADLTQESVALNTMELFSDKPTVIDEDVSKKMKRFEKDLQDLPPHVAETVQNLSFSLTSMGAGLIGAGGGAIAGLGVTSAYTAPAGGIAAAGTVAFKLSKRQIQREYLNVMNDRKKNKRGEELTRNEEIALLSDFDPIATKYALWEAGPEAISAGVGFSFLVKPLTKLAGKAVTKNVLARLGGFYGEEAATETWTEMGQTKSLMDTAVSTGEVSWKNPYDWGESFKQIAPQTFILTTLLGGSVSLTRKLNTLRKEVKNKKVYEALKKRVKDLHETSGLVDLATNQAGFIKIPNSIKRGIKEEAKNAINKNTSKENFVRQMVLKGHGEEQSRAAYEEVILPKQKTWEEVIEEKKDKEKVIPENYNLEKTQEHYNKQEGAYVTYYEYKDGKFSIHKFSDTEIGISNVEVKEKGRGTGTEMMNNALDFIKNKFHEVEISIYPESQRNRNFYKKFGFYDDGKRMILNLKKKGGKLNLGDEDLRGMGIPTQTGKDLEQWGQELYAKQAELDAENNYLNPTEEDKYKSFKKTFPGLKKLREIEDVEQLKARYPSINKERIDDIFWSQEYHESEIFDRFKERRIVESNLRGVQTVLNQEMKEFKKEYNKWEGKREITRDKKGKEIKDPDKILGTKTKDFITRRKDLLVKDKLKAMARAAKTSKIETRKDIKQAQDFLFNALKNSSLKKGEFKNFIPVLKSIKSKEDLIKKIPKIQRRVLEITERRARRTLKNEIKNEIKRTKPEKQGKRPVSRKLDPETNRLFSTLRGALKKRGGGTITKQEARERLAENLKEYLPKDESSKAMNVPYEIALENKVLSMWGMDSMGLEELLDEIRVLKEKGKQAALQSIQANKRIKEEEVEFLLRILTREKGEDINRIQERLRNKYVRFKTTFTIPVIERSKNIQEFRENSDKSKEEIDEIFSDKEYTPNQLFLYFRNNRIYKPWAVYEERTQAKRTDIATTKDKFRKTFISSGHISVLDWYGLMETMDFLKERSDISLRERYTTHESDTQFRVLTQEFNERFEKELTDAYNQKNTRSNVNKKIAELQEEVNLGTFTFSFPLKVKLLEDGTSEATEIHKVKQEFIATKDELIKIYMELQDPTLTETFYEGMGWSQELVDKISETLTPNDKVFAYKQLELLQEQYERLNPVYRKLNGIDLPFNEFYSPIMRDITEQAIDVQYIEVKNGKEMPIKAEDKEATIDRTPNEELGVGILLNEAYYRNTVTFKSAKERVRNKYPIKRRPSTIALHAHMRESNYYIAYAERMNFLNKIFSDPRIKKSIVEKFGQPFFNSINKQLESISFNRNNLGTTVRSLDKLRKNFTLGQLAIKPVLTAKQYISTIMYGEILTSKELAEGVADFFKNPLKNYRTMVAEGGALRTRGKNMERDIKALMQSDIYKQYKRTHSFLLQTMFNVKLGDKGAIVSGSWAMRRAALKRGEYIFLENNAKLPKENMMEEIVRDYEEYSEETQQSGNLSRQSLLQKGGSFPKLFTMFLSTLRVYTQKELLTLRKTLQEGDYTKRAKKLAKAEEPKKKRARVLEPKESKKIAKTLMIVHIILPTIFTAVSNLFAWDEDSKKDYLVSAILGPFSGIYLFGETLEDMVRAGVGTDRFESSNPIVAGLGSFGDLVSQIRDTVEEHDIDDITIEEFFEELVEYMDAGKELASLTTGVPADYAASAAKGIKDILEDNVKRGLYRIGGWTDYYIEKVFGDDKGQAPPATFMGEGQGGGFKGGLKSLESSFKGFESSVDFKKGLKNIK